MWGRLNHWLLGPEENFGNAMNTRPVPTIAKSLLLLLLAFGVAAIVAIGCAWAVYYFGPKTPPVADQSPKTIQTVTSSPCTTQINGPNTGSISPCSTNGPAISSIAITAPSEQNGLVYYTGFALSISYPTGIQASTSSYETDKNIVANSPLLYCKYTYEGGLATTNGYSRTITQQNDLANCISGKPITTTTGLFGYKQQ
jgi:hypothetical protein